MVRLSQKRQGALEASGGGGKVSCRQFRCRLLQRQKVSEERQMLAGPETINLRSRQGGQLGCTSTCGPTNNDQKGKYLLLLLNTTNSSK
jgi:hypothetical protein